MIFEEINTKLKLFHDLMIELKKKCRENIGENQNLWSTWCYAAFCTPSECFQIFVSKPRRYCPSFLGIDPIIPITLVTLTNGNTILTLQNCLQQVRGTY